MAFLIMRIVFLLLGGIIAIATVIATRWACRFRACLRCVHNYPDEAYDYFMADDKRWLVSDIADADLVATQFRVPSSLRYIRVLGPIQFRVPKRYNRVVTIYGKSKDCFESLERFAIKMGELL